MWPRASEARAVLIVGAAAFASMYLLFSAGPVMVSEQLGSYGAGLLTTVFMLLTIAAQFATPVGLSRVPPAGLLALSLLLLGVPSLAYMFEADAWLMIVAAAFRGVGFGLMTIVCTVLVSHYAEPGRQGAALGTYGLATSLTGIVAPGLGVFLFEEFSRVVTAGAAFVIPLIGLALLAPIRSASPHPLTGGGGSSDADLGRRWTLARFAPLVIFVPVAVTYGGSYTFLPLFSSLPALGLLMLGLGFAAGRVAGGRLVDSRRSASVVVPFAFVTALGIGLVAWWPHPLGAALCGVVLGVGIGGTASASLAGMMASVPPARYGFVSTAWNLSFDLGIALGGLGLGLLIVPLGFAGGVSVLAGIIVVVTAVMALPVGKLQRVETRG